MADRLTQLQDCYDQLATQFYASIRYLTLHHNSSALTLPPPSSPQHNHNNSNSNANANFNHEHQESFSYLPEKRPDTPTAFASAQRELAQDLLLKTKQIEYLISVLPGVESSQEKQEVRIAELDVELREALEERKKAEEEREIWLGRVDGIIGEIKR
ncbi:MAG: RNA polymerase II mediator complex subunit [Alectoria fallacina]|uniref:Mediator of RNA polymerase II transcription subunit 21 n=1 Tax=Alectoria fallacina TaxID=1903189 RepID=A0A8H3J815_9LECA|nr:MAG: RNA polymerase II mediator complex subunit [Alectoria fallacina]